MQLRFLRNVSIAVGGLFAVPTEGVAQDLLAQLSAGFRDSESFGSACSAIADIDGDGVPDIVVGAPNTTINSTERGRVYLFSGATFQHLDSIDGVQMGGQFGRRVAGLPDLDGDGIADLLASSPYFDNGSGADSGRVFVYSGATRALIRFHDGSNSGWFGLDLASIRDLDGDGVDDYLIAAPQQGAGHVYGYSGATGSQLFAIHGWNPYQSFGESVAAAGDVDLDGIEDFAVDSRDSALGGGSGRGRVDVYSGATRSTIASLVGAAPDDGSLGSGLAGRADFDGDGIPDLVVGDANHYINGALGFGSVTVYSGATWSAIQTWLGPSPDPSQFGDSVAVLDDVNGDGTSDVLVGTVSKTGAAYLYSGKTGHALYEFASGNDGDYFGVVVTSADDLTGDGLTDLTIAAPSDSQFGFHSGRAYVYAGSPLFLQSNSTALNPGDTLDLSTHCREPSVLTALAIVEVGSIPTFNILDLGPADSLGERTLSATVPTGLSGLDLSLQAFADDSKQGVVASAVLQLTFL